MEDVGAYKVEDMNFLKQKYNFGHFSRKDSMTLPNPRHFATRSFPNPDTSQPLTCNLKKLSTYELAT